MNKLPGGVQLLSRELFFEARCLFRLLIMKNGPVLSLEARLESPEPNHISTRVLDSEFELGT